MYSDFHGVLATTRNVNNGDSPVKIGAIIDPGYYGITVDAANLDPVIRMTG